MVVRNPSAVSVTDDPQRTYGGLAANTAFYIARMGDYYYEHFVRMGYREQADAVRKAWEEGGSGAGTTALPGELVQQLGTAGSVEQCSDAIDEAEAAGFPVALGQRRGAGPEEARRNLSPAGGVTPWRRETSAVSKSA